MARCASPPFSPAVIRAAGPTSISRFPSLDLATSGNYDVKTSQLALPQDTCTSVYATSGYSASTRNLSRITLATDNVFRDDGAALQMATITGSVSEGFVATLTVGVAG